jgi:hypothetical protein
MMRFTTTRIVSVLLLLLALVCVQTHAATYTGSLTVANSWRFLGKFAYSTGTGTADIKFVPSVRKNFVLPKIKPKKLPGNAKMALFIDTDWDEIHNDKTLTCEQKLSRAKSIKQFSKAKQAPQQQELTFDFKVSQSIRPHVWFIVLANCEAENLPVRDKQGIQLDYVLRFEDSDGSHFGYDEGGLYEIHLILLFAWVGFLMKGLHEITELRKRGREITPLLIVFACASVTYWLSLFTEVIHLHIYQDDGVGSPVCNMLSTLLLLAFKCIIACAFLVVAWGYTITTNTFAPFQAYFVPVFIFVTFANVIFSILASTMSSPFTYHDFESFAGGVLVFFRVLLFIGFAVGVKSTLSGKAIMAQFDKDKRLSMKSKTFLKQFAVFAGLWYLSLPVLTIVSSIIAPYLRHKVVSLGNIIISSICIVIVGFMLLNKENNSAYQKVSTKNKSILGF